MDNANFERNISLEALLAEYEQQKEDIETYHLEELAEKDADQSGRTLLSKEDQKLLNDYEKNTELFTKAREALDFTKCSTSVIYDNQEFKCTSLLYTREEFAKLMTVLTGGFNKDFLDTLESTRIGAINPEVMDMRVYEGSINAPLAMEGIRKEIERQCGNIEIDNIGNKIIEEKTVDDLVEAINRTDKYREEYGLTSGNLIAKTLAIIDDQNINGQSKTLSFVRFDEEREQENDSVEIVESNDGFVMNTSAVTPKNEKALDEKIKNKNEVARDDTLSRTSSNIATTEGRDDYEDEYEDESFDKENYNKKEKNKDQKENKRKDDEEEER